MDRFEQETSLNRERMTGALGDAGEQPLEQIKSTFSTAVRKAAGALHRNAAQNEEQHGTAAQYGHQAADWLERSADYIQDFEPAETANKVREEVRRNPGRSLLIAGAAGLVLGAIFRRR